MKKALILANKTIFYDKDLKRTFKNLGVKNGDILCVHSELFGFGMPMLERKEFLQSLTECFFELIGEEGTLIMPTFTYSFCKNESYDKINSRSKMGVLSEFFRKQTGVKRTNDPIFSFALKGKKEQLFLKQSKSCFGKNCVYDTLANNNGKIILFGTQVAGYTFTHFIEEKARVPYRYFKEFKGKILFEDAKEENTTIKYYVRNLEKNSDFDVNKQIEILKQTNNFCFENFGNSCIVLIDAKAYLKHTLKALNQNLECLLMEEK